ncbi:hypothetical protein B0H14DRAFT_2636287 [Mycena olivaceomarginata]|nr:hypothetical protein B0H14DRAFT_2636287 [Mycena olivaceomarginata]
MSAQLGWPAPMTEKEAEHAGPQPGQMRAGRSTFTSFLNFTDTFHLDACLKLRLPSVTAVSGFLVKSFVGFPQNFLIWEGFRLQPGFLNRIILNVEPFEIGPEIPIILATKNPPHRVHLEELGFGFSLESAEAVWAMSCEALTMLAENYHQTLITTCDDPSTHIGTGYSGDHDASNCGAVLPFLACLPGRIAPKLKIQAVGEP